MQANSQQHKLFHFHIYPFESGKCRKEGIELQKCEYLGNQKSFFEEKKTFFIVFKGLSFGGKIKILLKIVDTIFKLALLESNSFTEMGQK